jgi:quinol monooxygenase YgiN
MKPRDIINEIISTATIKALPQKRNELCLTINSLVKMIRSEAGCRSYQFYGEEGDENSFLLIGEWETRDDWANHLESESFAVLLGSMKLLSSQPKIEFRLLSHVMGIEVATNERCEPFDEARPIFIS